MDSKLSADSAGIDKPVKRGRKLVTLENKLDVVTKMGHRESAQPVAFLHLLGRRCSRHQFLCFVGGQLCYVCLQSLVVSSAFHNRGDIMVDGGVGTV